MLDGENATEDLKKKRQIKEMGKYRELESVVLHRVIREDITYELACR